MSGILDIRWWYSQIKVALIPFLRVWFSWAEVPYISVRESKAIGSSFPEITRLAKSVKSVGIRNVKLFPKSAFLLAEEKVKILSSNF